MTELMVKTAGVISLASSGGATAYFAMNETTIGAWFAGITTLVVTVSMLLQKRAESRRMDQANARMAKEDADKRTQRLKLQGVIVTLEKIHADGNSSMGNVLRLLAQTQRRLAQKENNQAEIELAEKAEARADAHDAVQADIDARQVQAQADLSELEKQDAQL